MRSRHALFSFMLVGCGTESLRVPPTQGSLALHFAASIAGNAFEGGVSAISIVNNVGTLRAEGKNFKVIAYERQPWSDSGLVIFQTLAVADDRWLIVFLYCQDGQLTDVFYESTKGGGLKYERATGTCQDESTPTNTTVDLPASVLFLPPTMPGHSIRGNELSYDGKGPGFMRYGGSDFRLFPIATVDCTALCGPFAWYELHSLFVRDDDQQTGVGILYFFPSQPSEVLLSYSLSLPDLNLFSDTTFAAAWSVESL